LSAPAFASGDKTPPYFSPMAKHGKIQRRRLDMTPEELKTTMQEHRLNVKRVASLLSVSKSAVYRWLKGERSMPQMAVDLLIRKLEEAKYLTVSGAHWKVN